MKSPGTKAIREGVAVAALPQMAVIAVTGSDRASWLHGLTTQGVDGLPPWSSRYACVLTSKGKIVSDLQIFVDGSRLLLELPADRVALTIEHLERRLVIEDAALQDLRPTRTVLTVQGPGAPAALGAGAAECFEAEIGQCPVFAGARSHTGEAGYDLVVESRCAAAVFEALQAAGAVAATEADLETARIEAAIPAHGTELGDDVLPLEALLRDAIHWSKGCYLGQETIARMAHRGHTNRELRQLIVAGEAIPARGDSLFSTTDASRPAGFVTSACWSPQRDTILALAFVRREHFDPGTVLHVHMAGAEARAEVTAKTIRSHSALRPENDPGAGRGGRTTPLIRSA